MNKWTVNIDGKPYFSIYFIGENSTNFNFGKLPKQGLFKKIKDFVKKNREPFLHVKVILAKIDDTEVRFKKIR